MSFFCHRCIIIIVHNKFICLTTAVDQAENTLTPLIYKIRNVSMASCLMIIDSRFYRRTASVLVACGYSMCIQVIMIALVIISALMMRSWQGTLES